MSLNEYIFTCETLVIYSIRLVLLYRFALQDVPVAISKAYALILALSFFLRRC